MFYRETWRLVDYKKYMLGYTSETYYEDMALMMVCTMMLQCYMVASVFVEA